MESTCVRNEWAIISVEGQIDRDTVPALYLQIQRCLGRGQVNILLDMRRATFLDSSALGILVRGYKDARVHGGELALTRVPDSIRSILEYTRLDGILRQVTSTTPPNDPSPLEAA